MCAGPAPLPRKNHHATETVTREQAAGRRTDASQETGSRTVDGQTQQETGNPRANILHPKSIYRVGCWNVRTLYQTGKIAQVVREMEHYNIELLGVSETRWTDSGAMQLTSGHHILYSGRTDGHHSRGVGIITSRNMHNCLLEWKPISERLIKARYNSTYAKLTVIVCYAPTEDTEEEEKDTFYDSLQRTVDETPRHDVLLVMGDLNAKVGSDNEGKEGTMGREGLGDGNNNGERLSTFCQENNLVIGGTLFMHKNIHKVTWNSPDGQTKNQIDHVIINKRWRGSLMDVVARHGADAGSDHSLVLCKIRLKLRKAKKRDQRSAPLDISKLKDPRTKRAFQLEIRNRFSLLMEQDEVQLECFNDILLETGKELLGQRKRKKEEWISENTWRKIDERKEKKRKVLSTKSQRLKGKLQEEYRQLDKEVKRSARTDKKNFTEKLAEEAELAAAKQDMKTLYQLTKRLSGKFQTSNLPVKDEQGNQLSKQEDILKRWKDHFEKVLNINDPECEANITPAENTLPISCETPTLNEVKKAIASLKNGKAPGADQVNVELLKADENFTPELLTKILGNIWNSEELPACWKTGLIVKLPKKGDLKDCNNWRGIMLLSATSKVLSRVILNRISASVDPLLRKEQAGFRKGRSCADQIFTLRQIVEQSNEWNSPVYANFIDFTKAFDSINRPALWKILSHYGIPDKLINIIRMLYVDFSARVICGTDLTEEFLIHTGVKQGCLLSPLLFTLCIDWVMKEITAGNKRGISWTLSDMLEDLDFADDLALLSHRHQDIQSKTNDLASKGKQIGLNINTSKTKLMKINTRAMDPVTLAGKAIEEVQEFIYLGSKITADGNSENDVLARIAKARGAFASLKDIWKSSKIGINTKLRIFKSNVLGVLLYGAESWKLTTTIISRIDVFQTRCLRRILRIFWPRTISNAELYRRTNTRPLSTEIKERRWKWIGHVLRMQPDSIPRVAMRWTPPGRRKRGRPRETWRRTTEREMNSQGWTWGQIQRLSQDRQQWRALVMALCANQHEED